MEYLHNTIKCTGSQGPSQLRSNSDMEGCRMLLSLTQDSEHTTISYMHMYIEITHLSESIVDIHSVNIGWPLF